MRALTPTCVHSRGGRGGSGGLSWGYFASAQFAQFYDVGNLLHTN